MASSVSLDLEISEKRNRQSSDAPYFSRVLGTLGDTGVGWER